MAEKITFQILDSDYIHHNNKPLVRLFGRTDAGQSVSVFFDKMLPYFYILPAEGKEKDLVDEIKKTYGDLILNICKVQKKLPIGYHNESVGVIKVVMSDPSKTPFIRDGLKATDLVKEIFEADILFKYRFMNDYNLLGMGWYEATGNHWSHPSVNTEIQFKADSFKAVERIGNMKFKYMSMDIETFMKEEGAGKIDPEKNPIIIMSMYFYPAFRGFNTLVFAAKKIKSESPDIKGFSDEREMLSKFLSVIKEYDPDIILGYNISGFDIPYLNTRLRVLNLPTTIGRCNEKKMRVDTFSGRTRVSISGRVFLDMYGLVKEAANKFGLFKGIKRYGLGDVSQFVLKETKVDVAHSEITRYWNEGGENLNKLLDYARKDAELPIKILFKLSMLDKFIEISKLSGINLQDCLDSGETQRIDSILLREFNRKNFVMPCKPDDAEVSRRGREREKLGLKGAFVLDPVLGFHDKCIAYLDYQSMYANIVISYNICPTTYLNGFADGDEYNKTPSGAAFVKKGIRRGILPEVLEYLLKMRSAIKKQMKNANDPAMKNYYYAKQYAFKTVGNAIYGYSGYVKSRLYVIDIANGITSVGREMTLKTKEIVETKTTYKVVYGDTDSCQVKFDTIDVQEAFKLGGQVSDLINREIKNILQIKIDSIFKSTLYLAKKRYAAWNFEPMENGWDESIMTKGIETVRRDWCDLVSDTLNVVLDIILKEQDVDKAVLAVKKIIQDVRDGKIPIEKFVITKGASMSPKSYKGIQPHIELLKKMRARDPASAPGVGDRIGFVIVRGPEMLSKRAEDPEYVRKNKIPIDSDYYINKQLLPPLERVFESMRIKRGDLISKGRQTGLGGFC